jgi:uncharacterized membrane protein
VDDSPSVITTVAADPRHISYTHLMYGLHVLSIVVGVSTTLLGHRTYLFGLPSIAAVAINFLRRGRVRDTWLASHFRWHLRTVCWAAVALVMVTLAFNPFAMILTRVPLLETSYTLIGAWAAWRAARGWRALREGRAIQPAVAT